jgi:antitoxin ParD1/3/4
LIQTDLEKALAMSMNVNLTPQLEELVRRKVATGMYNSASEVVRDALRLMEEQDQIRALRLEQLRTELQRGLDSGAGQAWDVAEVKQQLRARKANTKAAT